MSWRSRSNTHVRVRVAFFIRRLRAIASNSWSVSGSNLTCTLPEKPRVACTCTASINFR
jgi:hypothetical protein